MIEYYVDEYQKLQKSSLGVDAMHAILQASAISYVGESIAKAIREAAYELRTDHPLMGESLGGIESAISSLAPSDDLSSNAIAINQGLEEIARAISKLAAAK